MRDTPKANLKDLLVGLEAGQTLGSGELQLIPLTRTDGRAVPGEYVLAAEAFKRQTLHVTEVSEHRVVGQLLAVSETDLPVLFIDGEELLGAKQNRILNTDVLLRPRAKATIPVSHGSPVAPLADHAWLCCSEP